MDAIGSGPGAEDAKTRPVPRAVPPAPRGRKRRALLAVLGLAVALLVADFFIFVHQMPETEVAPARKADGIVALTGGPFRINDALDLLAAGRGKRLLISGVNPATRPGEISRLVPEHQRWFTCCVDIDYSANTIGNAVETRRWAKARGFQSLIVVTANFHIPRAMFELGHELPDVTLVPFGVVSDKVRVEAWWENPETARLLSLEYLKYIVARVRFWLPFLFE
jgi:uncharacterized SAM-binding protein YcdF (DUF218 family)